MIRVTDVIRWKYPDAKFQYGGDQVNIGQHVDQHGNPAQGLVWLDDNINKPTKKQIDSWRPKAEDFYEWDIVREKRDSLLAKSDYVMMADFPLEDKSDWEAYRQELRDIPQDHDDPDDVEYPNEPS